MSVSFREKLYKYCTDSDGKYHTYTEYNNGQFHITVYCPDNETLTRSGTVTIMDGQCRDLLWLLCQKDGVSFADVTSNDGDDGWEYGDA